MTYLIQSAQQAVLVWFPILPTKDENKSQCCSTLFSACQRSLKLSGLHIVHNQRWNNRQKAHNETKQLCAFRIFPGPLIPVGPKLIHLHKNNPRFPGKVQQATKFLQIFETWSSQHPQLIAFYPDKKRTQYLHSKLPTQKSRIACFVAQSRVNIAWEDPGALQSSRCIFGVNSCCINCIHISQI